MATKQGDVDLVIRAKNDASKSLDTVAKALDALVASQDELGSSSDKAAKGLADIAKLAATVGAAYSKIQSDSDRAAAALSRQESSLVETKATYQALTSQLEAAARVQARLRGEMEKDGADKTALAAQLKLVDRAYADLSSQLDKVSRRVQQQEDGYKNSFYALQELTGGAQQAAEALNRVRQAHEQAGQAAQQAAAREQAAAQAVIDATNREKAAREQAAAEAAAQAAATEQNAARRAALELRRSMQDAAGGSQREWQEAQAAIRGLAEEMARTGTQSSQQIADMERLRATAGANKLAYNDLRIAIELYTRVLRDPNATTQQLVAATERARVAMAGAANAMVSMSGSAGKASSDLRGVGKASEEAAGGATKLDKSLETLFQNSRRSLSLYQRVRGEVLSLANSYLGLYAAISGVNNVMQASMQTQGVQSRLNVVAEGDPQKAVQQFQWIKDEADRLGFSLVSLSNEWSKFAVSATSSNFTMEQSRKVFLSVAEAGRVLKLDSNRMELALAAITQMMSKGSIQAEELRQQLGEHIPGSFALMAKAVGVSTAELTKMMEQGQLTSDYLIKFADVLREQFGGQLEKSLQSTQAELGRFQTAIFQSLNKIAEAGVMEELTKAMRTLREQMNSADAEVWFSRLGAAAGGVIRVLMAIIANLDLIIAGLTALGAAKGVAYVLSLVGAFRTMVLEIRTATTAVAGLNAVTAALGGPIGIAIGVLAGAFAFLATRVRESETAMVNAESAVGKITQAYREGASSAKEWADSLKGLSNLQLGREQATLQRKLQDELKEVFKPFDRAFLTRANASNSPLAPVFTEMSQLAEKVKAGIIPVEDFKNRLDEIAKTHPELAKVALQMQDSATNALKTESALRRFEASLRLMRGEATEADKTLLGLAKSTSELSDAQMEGSQAMGRYTQAMDRLSKKIPELKSAMAFNDGMKEIQKDLQTAFDNSGGDEGLKQAAMDRAAKAAAALREDYDKALIKEFSTSKADAMLSSVNMLRQFEGFRSNAYWDVNAYRTGYGSSTTTAADGTVSRVTRDTTVDTEGALRDLVRRIGEFQDVIKRQIGTERFSAFGPEAQAALTSIAYNYGQLPDRIIGAVKTGTTQEIAQAVRSLRNDNGGVNAGRRETEARAIERSATTLDASTQKIIDERDARVKKVIEDLVSELKKSGQDVRERFIEDAVRRAQPTDPNAPRITQDDEQRVRQQAGETFDGQQRLVVQQEIVRLEKELAQSKAGSSRESFIAAEAERRKIDLLTEEGQKWAELQGQIWDRANAEKQVNDLMSVRRALMEQLTIAQNTGDTTGSETITAALDDVNAKLQEAINKAIAFWESMSPDTNPQAQSAIINLRNLSAGIKQGSRETLDARQINQNFVQGATNGFMSMAEAVADWGRGIKTGKEALGAIRDAFLKFAADFLLQIAQMILKQALFNALSGAGGGGGIGGFVAGLFKHSGGLVTGASGGESKTFHPSIFQNAMRYHTGGIAGLAPNEVPAILERGEEVLTATDPRNIANGGGAQSRQPVNVKIVNAIDSGSVVSDGLNTRVGEESLINYIQANRGRIRSILG